MDVIGSMLEDRVQSASFVAVKDSIVPWVEKSVRSNKYGLSRNPES